MRLVPRRRRPKQALQFDGRLVLVEWRVHDELHVWLTCAATAPRRVRACQGGLRWRPVVQDEGVPPLGWVELERIGKCRQHFHRGMHIAPLLELGVPGGPYAGEQGDLFAAQPGCSPAEPFGQADIGGRQLFAAGTQEVPNSRRRISSWSWRPMRLLIVVSIP